jgi:protein-S-isoprenylcysteine O-methyltransferase Ste14
MAKFQSVLTILAVVFAVLFPAIAVVRETEDWPDWVFYLGAGIYIVVILLCYFVFSSPKKKRPG